jgi:DNA-directed RNA polymerase subunit RPC12/RpoP
MSDEPFDTPNRKPARVMAKIEKPASTPAPVEVSDQYEGAKDSIVARPISGSHAPRFEDQYLCPKCGQSGVVGIHALKAGGTATCPECGAAMNKARLKGMNDGQTRSDR